MPDTSARLLKLLYLLQTHRDWSGRRPRRPPGGHAAHDPPGRRAAARIGYPVDATQGTPGYRLGAGAALPPLLLEDDEAVAVAIGLRTAAGGSVAGIEETSLRALTKLEQVLPSRLRYRVNTLHNATVRAGVTPGPRVSADTLMVVAEACRRRERLRFDYRSPRGGDTVRAVEPHSLVNYGRHWYVVAFDTERDDWRTFRVDRLTPRTPTGPRFAPRRPPYGDVATYLSHQLSSRTWPSRATVRLHESADAISAGYGPVWVPWRRSTRGAACCTSEPRHRRSSSG